MKKNFSYSEMASWEFDRDKYIKEYIEGEAQPPNEAMLLGSTIHAVIEDPRYPWLEELLKRGYDSDRIKVIRKLIDKAMKKRPAGSEVVLTAKTPYGTTLLAKMDGFDKVNRRLDEYKTTENPARWSKYAVDTNEQISFYSYVYSLSFHSFFRDIVLHSLDTKKGNMKSIPTARGPRDLAYIAEKIERVCDEIAQAGLWEKRLSRKDRDKKNQLIIPV